MSAPDRPSVGLSASGLTKIYGETVALWNVDVRAATLEAVAIRGANGSGKSTLLRILAGLAAPTRGQVTWSGIAGRCPPRIAFVGHQTHLFAALTALENLALAAQLARADPDRCEGLLAALGVASSAAIHCGSLSAGTSRRVALARALVTDPEVLLLDEPFAALDGAAADLVAEMLTRSVRDGRLVIFASHDDARSQAIADRTITLDQDQLFRGRHADTLRARAV